MITTVSNVIKCFKKRKRIKIKGLFKKVAILKTLHTTFGMSSTTLA